MSRRALMLLGLGVAVGGVACERPPARAANDTPASEAPLRSGRSRSPGGAEAGWDATAGPVLLVHDPSTGAVHLVPVAPAADPAADSLPLEASAFDGLAVDLVVAGSSVVAARVAALPPRPDDDCATWPLVAVRGDSTLPRTWTAGFARGRFTPIPFDSLGALPSPDSARLGMQVARLASALPGDTVPELQGLPYRLRRAHRFSPPDGGEVLVAEVTRALNQEATPRQEHLLLIAERAATPGASYVVRHAERASGTEETLESTEVVAIGMIGMNGLIDVILARYSDDTVSYESIERSRDGRWAQRWIRRAPGC